MYEPSRNIENCNVSENSNAGLAAAVAELRARLELLEARSHPSSEIDSASSDDVRSHIRARALRFEFFKWELFSDPTWDMLLELYASKLEHVPVSVSELCAASGVPPTTALRWIGKLEREGLITRRNDPLDGRRVWIELSESGCVAMHRYFEALSSSPLPT